MSANIDALNEGILSRVRARGIPDTIVPLRPEEGFAHWVAWIKRRIAEHWDCVLVITGPEGTGKSTLALKLAYAIDPTYNLKERLCYTATDVMKCFETVDSGKVAVFDESARALLATDTFSREQKALVQALQLIREKGLITVLCLPRLEELAKSMRSRRATLWIHLPRRGIGIIHVRDDRLRYRQDPNDNGFSRSPQAPMLRFEPYAPDSPQWMEYLAVKQLKLAEYLTETRELLEGRGGRRVNRRAARGQRTPERKREVERLKKQRWRARSKQRLQALDDDPKLAAIIAERTGAPK